MDLTRDFNAGVVSFYPDGGDFRALSPGINSLPWFYQTLLVFFVQIPVYSLVMTYEATGSALADITDEELRSLVESSITKSGPSKRAIALPPDLTRHHSRAGLITDMVYGHLGSSLAAVMPALGTHIPMTCAELGSMFPKTPLSLFRSHDWRNGVTELGRIEGSFVSSVSGGLLDYDWPVQTNRDLVSGAYDKIISIGQVVPHEVVGMANQAKNIFVGAGGKEAIDKSHFLGAVYGMERMMGRTNTPVRALFDEALARYGSKLPPILWMLTVVGQRQDGSLALRGFFSGDDRDCFERAAALSREVNLDLLDVPLKKAVVWLDPSMFRTTWIGNKAVYRTRMAMADGGELVVIAPGLERFGEDLEIDALIRKYGYRSGKEIVQLVADNADLAASMSAAAHLIHGCPEGRFTVTYAPGPGVTKEEIESVDFGWTGMSEAVSLYRPEACVPGWNTNRAGEPFFFIPNPSLGLWSHTSRFANK